MFSFSGDPQPPEYYTEPVDDYNDSDPFDPLKSRSLKCALKVNADTA